MAHIALCGPQFLMPQRAALSLYIADAKRDVNGAANVLAVFCPAQVCVLVMDCAQRHEVLMIGTVL